MKNLLLNGLLMSACLFCSCKKQAVDQVASNAGSVTSNSTAQTPAVPTNLRLDPTFQQTPFTARLIWDAPTNVDVLVYRAPSTQIADVVSVNAFRLFGRWQYALNNLQQNTSYTFQVQSQAFTGVRSALSKPFTFTTLPTNDRVAPSTPNLQFLNPTPGFVIARWTASTDNFDPASEITYEIYNAQTGRLLIKVKGQTELQGSADNVATFEDCAFYVVRARDRTGNLSEPSNTGRASFFGCQ